MEAVSDPSSRGFEDDRVAIKSMKRMHDEGYLYITNGLTSEEQGSKSQALYLYDKGLLLIDRALARYSGDNESANRMKDKMAKTRVHIVTRSQDLRAQIAQEHDVAYHGTASSSTPSGQVGGPGASLYPVVNREPTSITASAAGASASNYTESSGAMYPTAQDMSPNHAIASQKQDTSQMDVCNRDNSSESAESCHENLLSDHIQVASNMREANASKIFEIGDGVQIFFITAEGYVSVPSYPSSLKIYSFTPAQQTSDSTSSPPAFLKVGEWAFPLVPGYSPVLHTTYGAYMFPDLTSQQQGASVGVIISDEVAADVRDRFELLLGALTNLAHEAGEERVGEQVGERPATPPPRPPLPATATAESEQRKMSKTEKIAKGLVVGSEYVAYGVCKGAEVGSQLIRFGSQKLREKYMKPRGDATADKPVDPTVQKTLQIAHGVTEVGVRVSGYVVSELSRVTRMLGERLAPEVRKQVDKVTPASMKQADRRGSSKMDNVVHVTAAGWHGFSTVYHSLEQAAMALGRSLKDETVRVVNHKYGNEAGVSADYALGTAGNVMMTTYNVQNLGVKAMLKRTGKETAKATLKDMEGGGKGQGSRRPGQNGDSTTS